MEKRLIFLWCMVVVTTVLVLGGIQGQASAVTGPTACGSTNSFTVTQLLRDTTFGNGVKHGENNTYPAYLESNCRNRWLQKVPSLANASWSFTEIAEKTYFCENSATPTNLATLSYASADYSKQFIDSKNGTVRFIFDSSKEWRQGCQLNLPSGGVQPKFPDPTGQWTWPHFLLDQVLTSPVSFGTYNDLVLTAQITLKDIARIGSADCAITDWNPHPQNHALFYIGLVLTRQSGSGPLRFYALVPAFNTYNGSTNVNPAPWLGGDPVGAQVYYSPGQPVLTKGTTTNYNIKVETIAAEAVAAYNQRNGTALALTNYKLSEILIGWEIWGGYKTEVEVKGLALNAYTYSQHDCSNYYMYWSGSASDHYYTLDYYPGGFYGYVYQGVLGQTPTVALPGTQPLYRYLNASIGDHYYTQDLYPLGFGGYVYEGLSALGLYLVAG